MKEFWHIVRFGLIGIVAAMVLGMTVLFFASHALVKLGEKTDVSKKADAIFVPGARIGGRALNLRLDMALELYDLGFAPLIVVSGGQGLDEPTTEAAFMAAYLATRGVPEDAILQEDESFSTDENFKNSVPIFVANDIKSIIITTNDYHCYRCGKLAQKYGMAHQIRPVPKPKGVYLRGPFRETLAVMWAYFTHGLDK